MDLPFQRNEFLVSSAHLLLSTVTAWGMLFTFEVRLALHAVFLFGVPSTLTLLSVHRLLPQWKIGNVPSIVLSVGIFVALGLVGWLLSFLDGVPGPVLVVAWPGLVAWKLLCWDVVPCPGN